MITSESIKAIAPALVKAQAAFGSVTKKKTGQIGNQKYKYATLDQVLDAVMPALAENGIAVVQTQDFDAVLGSKYVIVYTLLMHESGEWIRTQCLVPSTREDAQGFGSAIAYARRYGLMSTVCLAAEDDDGAAASTPAPPMPKRKIEFTSVEVDDTPLMIEQERSTKPPAPVPARSNSPSPAPVSHLNANVPTDGELIDLFDKAGLKGSAFHDFVEKNVASDWQDRKPKKFTDPERVVAKQVLTDYLDKPTPEQRKKAMALHRELGQDDDERHNMYAQLFGKHSITALTKAQMAILIDNLEAAQSRRAWGGNDD